MSIEFIEALRILTNNNNKSFASTSVECCDRAKNIGYLHMKLLGCDASILSSMVLDVSETIIRLSGDSYMKATKDLQIGSELQERIILMMDIAIQMLYIGCNFGSQMGASASMNTANIEEKVKEIVKSVKKTFKSKSQEEFESQCAEILNQASIVRTRLKIFPYTFVNTEFELVLQNLITLNNGGRNLHTDFVAVSGKKNLKDNSQNLLEDSVSFNKGPSQIVTNDSQGAQLSSINLSKINEKKDQHPIPIELSVRRISFSSKPTINLAPGQLNGEKGIVNEDETSLPKVTTRKISVAPRPTNFASIIDLEIGNNPHTKSNSRAKPPALSMLTNSLQKSRSFAKLGQSTDKKENNDLNVRPLSSSHAATDHKSADNMSDKSSDEGSFAVLLTPSSGDTRYKTVRRQLPKPQLSPILQSPVVISLSNSALSNLNDGPNMTLNIEPQQERYTATKRNDFIARASNELNMSADQVYERNAASLTIKVLPDPVKTFRRSVLKLDPEN
eukprot:NODE_559_length_6687_cov_0.130237.p1 type:complete len:503 gc:universal NODE_559_length_6687_cov_0.130237:6585-5077(-)